MGERFAQSVVGGEKLEVDELIKKQELRNKLEREIAALERKSRSEKQPRKKFELVEKVKKMRKEMELL